MVNGGVVPGWRLLADRRKMISISSVMAANTGAAVTGPPSVVVL
jgi:hypothetical protein